MKKVVVATILYVVSVTALAVDSDSRRFGVLSSASMMAEGGTFMVVDECVKRFPDLSANDEKVKTDWLARNRSITILLAITAKKVADRLKAKAPDFDMQAMTAMMLPHAQQAMTKMSGTIIQSALNDKDAATQRLGCQRMFQGIDDGRMDILTIQKGAVRAYGEEGARELVHAYKGLTYKDDAARVEANGTWLGLPAALNESRLVADENTRTIQVFSKTMMPGSMPGVSENDKTIFIDTWSEDVIRSERERAGKSERFVQYVIDRKAKTVSMVFTGESPATYILGDAKQEFRQARAQYE